MNGIAEIGLINFIAVYLMLLIVLFIMKLCRINQSKLLVTAGLRMSLQLIITGYILTYIFSRPHPLFVVLYLGVIYGAAVHTVISRNRDINRRFKIIMAVSLFFTGIPVVAVFIAGIVNVSFWNPQYTIPVSGMIMGNSMTGISLGLKTFHESVQAEKHKISVLINIGAEPENILLPFVNRSVETALLPTLNSMLGMGIVSLPGMMTGQILSGTLPLTAITYQIAIMIAITAAVCLSVFFTLYFGCRTLITPYRQIRL